MMLLSVKSDVRESQSSKVHWVRSSYARQQKRKEEGLTLHQIFELHDKPHTPRQLLNTNSPYSGSKRLEDSRLNLFSVLALEGKLATLDLPVQTHLDGYHKFRDEGKRNSTETKKLSAKLGKG